MKLTEKVCYPLLLLFLFSAAILRGQTNYEFVFEWAETPSTIAIGNNEYRYYKFKNGVLSDRHPSLPLQTLNFPVNGPGKIQVEVLSAEYEPIDLELLPQDQSFIKGQLQFSSRVYQTRNRYTGKVAFAPIITSGGQFQRLTKVQIKVSQTADSRAAFRTPNDVRTSVLSDGLLYKIAVTETGMQKLTYNFLRNDLGIDIDQVDPRTISILGDRGGILPFFLEREISEDVPTLPIQIVGETDGSFDQQDYILFYGEGVDKWDYDPNTGIHQMQKNIYDTKNYYFIKIGSSNAPRLANQEDLNVAGFVTDQFDDYARFEEDKVNLFFQWGQETLKAQGSGQHWFGDRFKNQRSYQYDNLFNFPGLVTSDSILVTASMALRALNRSSFNLSINGITLRSENAARVNVLNGFRDNETEFAHLAILSRRAIINSEQLNFVATYDFPRPNDGSEGWLDYIQVNVKRQLALYGQQTAFRSIESLNHAQTRFNINTTNNGVLIWDISDPLNPQNQQFTTNNGTLSFATNTETLKEFIAFDPTTSLNTPEAVGNIPTQNLHGIDNVDLVIVYHPDFESQATRLANHRNDFSNFNVATVTVEQVMNEFASGATDPTAIRNFAKLLADRNEKFKYLLLFGDGSFDTRNVYELGGDFVPTFQEDSLNPLFSFPSDDYFAILSSNRKGEPLDGDQDIGVGRLPAETLEEAQILVDKIINYDSKPQSFDSWRNRLVFVGDDEDNNLHVDDVDAIANSVDRANNIFNLEKIYVDAFPQVSTPGGARFPAVNEAISNSLFRGTMAITYLGHGGPSGWAQERILNVSDIQGWTNIDKLPIFITATCTFGGYDDITFKTAGENVILTPSGGAIALLTTTRAVFATSNANLTQATIEELFFSRSREGVRLGDAMRLAKNNLTNSFTAINSRKFTLLGDPSQKLAIPTYNVQMTQINGVDVTTGAIDTVRALQRVTIKGIVTDEGGNPLNNFNGVIFPTVFDKKTTASTLGQDSDSRVKNYVIQNNILFKGRSSVTNGNFEFTFVVPKDINFDFGRGKISFYASDKSQLIDAAGAFDQIIIGGVDENVLQDDKGPELNVYMNTTDFVFGGITDENPVLLVTMEDDNGINVVGNSIGHDLEAVLDEDTQNTILLNDFYESELDDFTKGQAGFHYLTWNQDFIRFALKPGMLPIIPQKVIPNLWLPLQSH